MRRGILPVKLTYLDGFRRQTPNNGRCLDRSVTTQCHRARNWHWRVIGQRSSIRATRQWRVAVLPVYVNGLNVDRRLLDSSRQRRLAVYLDLRRTGGWSARPVSTDYLPTRRRDILPRLAHLVSSSSKDRLNSQRVQKLSVAVCHRPVSRSDQESAGAGRKQRGPSTPEVEHVLSGVGRRRRRRRGRRRRLQRVLGNDRQS